MQANGYDTEAVSLGGRRRADGGGVPLNGPNPPLILDVGEAVRSVRRLADLEVVTIVSARVAHLMASCQVPPSTSSLRKLL